MFWIESCEQQAGWNQPPVQEKGVCSDLNQTAQQLQMAGAKAWKLCLMILNGLQLKFAAKAVANELQ